MPNADADENEQKNGEIIFEVHDILESVGYDGSSAEIDHGRNPSHAHVKLNESSPMKKPASGCPFAGI